MGYRKYRQDLIEDDMTTIKNDEGCEILICPDCVKAMKEENKKYDFGDGDRENHYHCKNLYKAKDKSWGEYGQCNMSFSEEILEK